MAAIHLLMLVAGSCTTDPVPRRQIMLDALSTPTTKGYVEDTEMTDTSPENLHTLPFEQPARTIRLTTWLYPQTGNETEYFCEKTFVRESDGLWHGTPSVFWPIEGRLDMIGYSSTAPFPDNSIRFDRNRSTDALYLRFDKSYTQDDVLVSTAINKNVDDDAGRVPMTFNHSQAWIQFRLHTSTPAYDNILKVHKIVLKDIYTTGTLLVEHPYGYTEGSWNFRLDLREDTPMDDVHGIYGTRMSTEMSYLDMLIPEQPMKDIILHYSLEGSEIVMQYRFTLPSAYWLMGKKYIYDISFGPHEITLIPTLEDWDSQLKN